MGAFLPGESASYQLYQECAEPGDNALPENNAGCPAAPKLPLNRCDGGNTGGLQKAEHQKTGGGAF